VDWRDGPGCRAARKIYSSASLVQRVPLSTSTSSTFTFPFSFDMVESRDTRSAVNDNLHLTFRSRDNRSHIQKDRNSLGVGVIPCQGEAGEPLFSRVELSKKNTSISVVDRRPRELLYCLHGFSKPQLSSFSFYTNAPMAMTLWSVVRAILISPRAHLSQRSSGTQRALEMRS